MRECPQLVCHDLLVVVHSSKMTTFELEFEFWEKELVPQIQIMQIQGLQNHWKTLFGQNSIHRDGSVTQRSRDGASKCLHAQFNHSKRHGQFGDSNSTHYHHSDCQTLIRPHESPHLVTFSSVFDVQVLPERGLSSTLSRPPKNLCPQYNLLSISPF
jgi:hypothetical protein